MISPISFNADLVNIKKIMSRNVIQYVFEIDKAAIPNESRHALDDFQNEDTRLTVMVMPETLALEVKEVTVKAPLLPPEASTEEVASLDNNANEKGRKGALVGLHTEFFKTPGVAVWLGLKPTSSPFDIKAAYKKKMGVRSCAELTVEQIQASYKEFGEHKDKDVEDVPTVD